MQYISIHDGFLSGSEWAGFLQGSDRIMLDKHSYFSFGGSQPQPLDIVGANGYLGGQWPSTACSAWGGPTNERSVDVNYSTRRYPDSSLKAGRTLV